MAAKEKKGEPFPFVIVGLSIVAIAWQFGHLWWGVAIVAAALALPVVPMLLGSALLGAAVLVGSFVGVLYTLTLFVYQKVVRRGAIHSHP